MDIILGGTHGLGEELARQLQTKGRDVFVIGRSYKQTASYAGIAADLSSISDVKQIKECVNSSMIESFFWVAGYGYMGDFANQPDTLKMFIMNEP